MKNRRASGVVSTSALFLSVLTILTVCQPVTAEPVTISGVPSYAWYHGCTPTSVAMVLGYWDTQGYSNLFAAQGSDLYLTTSVQDEISSPAHNAKYDPTPDDINLPVPEKTSIADYLWTSVDPRLFGGTSVYRIIFAVADYAAYKGYSFSATNFRIGSGLLTESELWTVIVSEIDAGRPIILTVDSSGDGILDHNVAMFGYENQGINGKWYACYDTWNEEETPIWKKYQGMTNGNIYGVYGAVQVIPAPLPEPTTITLLTLALPLVLRRRKNAPPRQ